jgi:hypothetical protein
LNLQSKLPPKLPVLDRAAKQPSGAAGAALAHDSAAGHVSGRALYIDDQREPAGTVHVAPGYGPAARGVITRLDLGRPGPFLPRGPGGARHPRRGRRHDRLLSTQHPTEVQHMVAHVLGLPSHSVTVRGAAHGRRLRRQGDPGQSLRLHRRTGPGRPAGRPSAPRSRRRHDHDRQAPRLRRRLPPRLRRRDGRIQGRRCTSRRAAATRPTCRSAINDRALFHADNAYFTRTCPLRPHPCRTNTGLQHRLSRLRRPAGHGGAERPSRRSPSPPASTRSRCASATSTATAPQRHALPHDGRGQRHPASSRSWSADSDYWARASRPPLQCRALAEEGPGADAGQVRHLLHHDRLNQAGALCTSTPTARCR